MRFGQVDRLALGTVYFEVSGFCIGGEGDEAGLCDSDEKRVGGWREVKYNSQMDKAKVGGLPTWPHPMYDVVFSHWGIYQLDINQ